MEQLSYSTILTGESIRDEAENTEIIKAVVFLNINNSENINQ